MKVLYIASNPRDEQSLQLEREITELQARFSGSSSLGLTFTFLPGLRLEQLPSQISRIRPDILHISAHGESHGLVLAGERDGKLLTAEALRVFAAVEHPARLIILNACNSESMAKELTASVPMAIGTTAEITNEAARESVKLFYERILEGQSVARAFAACDHMVRTIDNGAVKAILCHMPHIDPDREFFPISPRIIARFQDPDLQSEKDGQYELGLGLIGCPPSTHQVVFFTDDASFVDEDSLEESLCLVVRGTTIRGVIWSDVFWYAYGDCRIFATGVTAAGEQFITTSMLSEALAYFHRIKTHNQDAVLPDALDKAIATLMRLDGSQLDDAIKQVQADIVPNTRRERTNGASTATRNAKPSHRASKVRHVKVAKKKRAAFRSKKQRDLSQIEAVTLNERYSDL